MKCTDTQGSRLYDATLGDEDLIESMYQDAIAEQSAKRKTREEEQKQARPSRHGYSREVEAIYDLIDNIVALRAEMGKWPPRMTETSFARRPWFPHEVVAERMRKRASARVNKAIEMAQQNWQEQHDSARRA